MCLQLLILKLANTKRKEKCSLNSVQYLSMNESLYFAAASAACVT